MGKWHGEVGTAVPGEPIVGSVMLRAAREVPEQSRRAWQVGVDWPLPVDWREPKRVVIAGGGFIVVGGGDRGDGGWGGRRDAD